MSKGNNTLEIFKIFSPYLEVKDDFFNVKPTKSKSNVKYNLKYSLSSVKPSYPKHAYFLGSQI